MSPAPALADGEWDMCRNGRYTGRGITRRAPLDRRSEAPEHRRGDIKAIIDFSQLRVSDFHQKARQRHFPIRDVMIDALRAQMLAGLI
jgi:hypothetical protein